MHGGPWSGGAGAMSGAADAGGAPQTAHVAAAPAATMAFSAASSANGQRIAVVARLMAPERCGEVAAGSSFAASSGDRRAWPCSEADRFANIFGVDASLNEVFDVAVQPLVSSTLAGYNSLLFTWGAHGIGKTTEVFGRAPADGAAARAPVGLAQLAAWQLFDDLGGQGSEQSGGRLRTSVRAACLELGGREVYDLLAGEVSSADICSRMSSPRAGDPLMGKTHMEVQSAEDACAVLATALQRLAERRALHPEGLQNRHCAFSLLVEVEGPSAMTCGRLTFVDLGGAPPASTPAVSSAGAVSSPTRRRTSLSPELTAGWNSPERHRGGDLGHTLASPATSLADLAQVVNALTCPEMGVPPLYKACPLTRLMREAIGGNCRTVLLLALAALSDDEVLVPPAVLKFAEHACEVINAPVPDVRVLQDGELQRGAGENLEGHCHSSWHEAEAPQAPSTPLDVWVGEEAGSGRVSVEGGLRLSDVIRKRRLTAVHHGAADHSRPTQGDTSFPRGTDAEGASGETQAWEPGLEDEMDQRLWGQVEEARKRTEEDSRRLEEMEREEVLQSQHEASILNSERKRLLAQAAADRRTVDQERRQIVESLADDRRRREEEEEESRNVAEEAAAEWRLVLDAQRRTEGQAALLEEEEQGRSPKAAASSLTSRAAAAARAAVEAIEAMDDLAEDDNSPQILSPASAVVRAAAPSLKAEWEQEAEGAEREAADRRFSEHSERREASGSPQRPDFASPEHGAPLGGVSPHRGPRLPSLGSAAFEALVTDYTDDCEEEANSQWQQPPKLPSSRPPALTGAVTAEGRPVSPATPHWPCESEYCDLVSPAAERCRQWQEKAEHWAEATRALLDEVEDTSPSRNEKAVAAALGGNRVPTEPESHTEATSPMPAKDEVSPLFLVGPCADVMQSCGRQLEQLQEEQHQQAELQQFEQLQHQQLRQLQQQQQLQEVQVPVTGPQQLQRTHAPQLEEPRTLSQGRSPTRPGRGRSSERCSIEHSGVGYEGERTQRLGHTIQKQAEEIGYLEKLLSAALAQKPDLFQDLGGSDLGARALVEHLARGGAFGAGGSKPSSSAGASVASPPTSIEPPRFAAAGSTASTEAPSLAHQFFGGDAAVGGLPSAILKSSPTFSASTIETVAAQEVCTAFGTSSSPSSVEKHVATPERHQTVEGEEEEEESRTMSPKRAAVLQGAANAVGAMVVGGESLSIMRRALVMPATDASETAVADESQHSIDKLDLETPRQVMPPAPQVSPPSIDELPPQELPEGPRFEVGSGAKSVPLPKAAPRNGGCSAPAPPQPPPVLMPMAAASSQSHIPPAAVGISINLGLAMRRTNSAPQNRWQVKLEPQVCDNENITLNSPGNSPRNASSGGAVPSLGFGGMLLAPPRPAVFPHPVPLSQNHLLTPRRTGGSLSLLTPRAGASLAGGPFAAPSPHGAFPHTMVAASVGAPTLRPSGGSTTLSATRPRCLTPPPPQSSGVNPSNDLGVGIGLGPTRQISAVVLGGRSHLLAPTYGSQVGGTPWVALAPSGAAASSSTTPLLFAGPRLARPIFASSATAPVAGGSSASNLARPRSAGPPGARGGAFSVPRLVFGSTIAAPACHTGMATTPRATVVPVAAAGMTPRAAVAPSVSGATTPRAGALLAPLFSHRPRAAMPGPPTGHCGSGGCVGGVGTPRAPGRPGSLAAPAANMLAASAAPAAPKMPRASAAPGQPVLSLGANGIATPRRQCSAPPGAPGASAARAAARVAAAAANRTRGPPLGMPAVGMPTAFARIASPGWMGRPGSLAAPAGR